MTTLNCQFSIAVDNEEFIVLIDHDHGASVTNDAQNVIRWLGENLESGLGKRNVYYRDTNGDYDELEHANMNFTSFRVCPPHIRQALAQMVAKATQGSR